MIVHWLIWIVSYGIIHSSAEYVRELEVSEGVSIGHQIGLIGEFLHGVDSGPPYLIVPVPGSYVDTDLAIDHTTGEIRTKVNLDRETRASYSLVAIPLSGENVRVVIRVLDENDNAPTFSTPVMHIEFPENTPRDVKRTLNAARDSDLGRFNTQRYNILSGNVNNAFRLSSHRERDGVLYLDLQINGFLDRESTPAYSLVIEALDGGSPPLRGQMTVNITIQDVNDNQPIFNQSRYFATVPENATVGTAVLQVYATDTDAGENGNVEYLINRRQSDKELMFRIDPVSGLISVNKPLDFETKELHELVVVAKDHGLQPLETTAFVSIRVTDVNDNQPIINVIFLSDDATPKISESAQLGEFIARISVNDPDSRTEYANINVTLAGGSGHFGLTTRDNIIYLVIVSVPLDREIQPNYTLNVVATDNGFPPLHASKEIYLRVIDVNDNAPEFEKDIYYANIMEVADPGTSVLQAIAIDRDEGNNSVIIYSLLNTPDTHSQWFKIDEHTGLITTRSHIDCETEPVPQLTILAKDNGYPPLSSSSTVLVTIHDVNDNEPIFDQSFYNVSVPENDTKGRCILKVSATDPDCGVNAMVNYTLGEGFKKLQEFEVRSSSGEVCISGDLDYETRNSYEFSIIATDRGGLSTTAMVKIQLTDVNDNRPTFYPREYNVSLRETDSSLASTPVVVVVATDPDNGRYGSVSYRIVAGNEAGIFRVDRITGEIFVTRPNMLSNRNTPYYRLNISASDGGGLRTTQDAEIFISIIDSAQRPPIFEKARYNYYVKEDVNRGTVVGSVLASSRDTGSRTTIKYSIYSGDPDGYFSIDSVSGNIRIANNLDHETKPQILLNIQATSGNPPAYGHTQVNIDIEDVNDNPPEFESSTVKISVPENVDLGTPLYAANAKDKDSGKSGIVSYRLTTGTGAKTVDSKETLFKVDSNSGHLTLTKHLDYEAMQRHSLTVTATDSGYPPLSANLTILVEVQDVNDNPPVFERSEYVVKVLESVAVNSQILQISAVDLDTGNNARLTYRILDNDSFVLTENNKTNREERSEPFGIFPNSGWIYLRRVLDRESQDQYDITVIASDNGTPVLTATTHITVSVSDANDNDPKFVRDFYEFSVEENLKRGVVVGILKATDADLELNAEIKYSLIPSNTSFQVNPLTGEIITRDSLDRELRTSYELVAEARDHGTPYRSTRVSVRINVTDVNDCAPDIVDPQEDVVSIREEQPIGTEVVRIRAIDRDNGYNATITYSILKGRDSDGYDLFSIDPTSGLIVTKAALDHEERSIYRLAVSATDNGIPSKQTIRFLRVEVLDLNDNRPTFTSSSLVFRVREDVSVGFIVGSVSGSGTDNFEQDNIIAGNTGVHITYTLFSMNTENTEGAFDIDRKTGSLVVSRGLDREQQSEYRLEIRALDTSSSNNPQSSAVAVKIEIADVNDNAPVWPVDPIVINVLEDVAIGSIIYNFSATDIDSGNNGEIQYKLITQNENTSHIFNLDPLTGSLSMSATVDYETISEYFLIIAATDQSTNVSERLTTTVTVRILITDINDNPPIFVLPSVKDSIVYLSDTALSGHIVTRILATDIDSDENGRITYNIFSGNENEKFHLNSNTGILELKKPINDDVGASMFYKSNSYNRGKYNLMISATDHGVLVQKETRINLVITIQATINSPPKFKESVYHINISENIPSGHFVIRIGADSYQPENGGNLTYYIPRGIADDHFYIDPIKGTVTTVGSFDRETKDIYAVPIYVEESSLKTSNLTSSVIQFDTTTLIVKITDINDHAPQFSPGSCYSLSIPENSDLAVIHTVVAMDLDDGLNGAIIYSITGGNIGNKFSIDMHSGELTARSLDREVQSRYILQITANDRGTPITYHTTCNISVIVEDQNDNDPRFELPKYTATIPEDIQIGTSVLSVKANDSDLGINARIVYSLANETQWLFNIDNRSGLITTAGIFDRERQHIYNFFIVATDGGKYESRSTRVPIQILVSDVNDNKPEFIKYPFKGQVASLVQPGQTLLQIVAFDVDQGTNGEIVYNIVSNSSNDKFRINPNTGDLSATQSLAAENGKIIHIEVMARDKGNPPQSTIGLIELQVGDINHGTPQLYFQNETYLVKIKENAPIGYSIVQLSAVRTDGRRQKIVYSLGNGNDDNSFAIDSDTGELTVEKSDKLDYETVDAKLGIQLIGVARTDIAPLFYGYCYIRIILEDENDNIPRFTQKQYSAVAWEGNNKGTFVIQVTAFDADQGSNSRVLYHIVDGNHDNAFIIEPAFSGIVKTNIVLDREIRDVYRLKVIATDEGVPQMTGTAQIRVHIVDINDNQPTFPPKRIIRVTEDTDVGSVLTAVTANDVDTHPPLTYSLDIDDLGLFSIDRFSGKIILKKPIDFETKQEFQLKILASDTEHIAHTSLSIQVIDVNDNPPIFQQVEYHSNLPDDINNVHAEILKVNATDLDSEDNSLIKYSIKNSLAGFSIGEQTGVLYANMSRIEKSFKPFIQLTIVATDSGIKSLSAATTVRINANFNVNAKSHFIQNQYRSTVSENVPLGTVVLQLASHDIYSTIENSIASKFEIVSGNEDGYFDITYPLSSIIVVKSLDRELIDLYNLRLNLIDSSCINMCKSNNSTEINVFIIVNDANDNIPIFKHDKYEATISEGAPLRYSIFKVLAIDDDQENTSNSEVVYSITSGNNENMFSIDILSGILSVNNQLDYDMGQDFYNLIIRACDSGLLPKCSLQPFHINLTDENDNEPRFPVTEYLEFIGENEPVGVSVFTARATDLDRGEFGKLNYSIESINGFSDIDESWKFFKVDPISGIVITNSIFDYEQRNRYTFTLKASDIGGKTASVKVRVMIDSRDEFNPQFTERTYRFNFANPSYNVPIGYIVGHVIATDRDKGPDGRIVYQLSTQHPYFKMNRTTGAVIVKKKLDKSATIFESGRDISLVVTASSGRQGSLTNMTVVEISIDQLASIGTNQASTIGTSNSSGNTGGLADWALGLLISLILVIFSFAAVFLFLHLRNRHHKPAPKPGLNTESTVVVNSNSYVDPSSFDTIPIRGNTNNHQGSNQFAPPKYDEIPPYGTHTASSNSGAPTTSELSGSEQSGSSGRGSAEDGDDGEDEEIRMINERPLQRDNGLLRINDVDGRMSDISVQNTQEYLARLGIVDNTATASGTSASSRRCSENMGVGSTKDSMIHPIDTLHMFEEEPGESDITNLIYAKLNEVTSGSDRGGSSTEEATTVGNIGAAVDHVMDMGGFGNVPVVGGGNQGMNGSLSSIVHSEEELTGSYNWDYLLDWGPQYQPLAHVFSEIARLKDDTLSVHSTNSAGASSAKSKNSLQHVSKNIPPPLLTNIAPRSIPSILSARGNPNIHITSANQYLLPRSPISHDTSGTGFSTSTAMSPSFSPSLSPLATRSPSISPHVPGVNTHHMVNHHNRHKDKH